MSPNAKKASLAAKFRGQKGGGGNVMPLLAKNNKPFVIRDDDVRIYYGLDTKKLEAEGYTGVVITGLDGEIVEQTVFDPKNIRSKFAAFDPAKKDSANLMHGVGAAGAGGLLMQEEEDRPRGLLDIQGKPMPPKPKKKRTSITSVRG
jgi:hypothetical protein